MAEKKFNGAPFGTQTARFDVTGVHPKNKVPGSFTQIPYDKYSMLEKEYGNHPATDSKFSGANKFAKVDLHLRNIRLALKSTKNDLKQISSLKRHKSITTGFETSCEQNKKIPIFSLESKHFIIPSIKKDVKQERKNEKNDANKKICPKEFIPYNVNFHLASFNTSGNSTSNESPKKISEENLQKKSQSDMADENPSASDLPATKVSSSGLPATKVSSSGLSATKVSSSSLPATKVSSSGLPATKVSSSGLPVTKVSSSGLPATKVSSSDLPATKVSSSGLPATKVSSSGLPATKVSSSGLPVTKVSSSGLPVTKVSSSGLPTTKVSSSGLPVTKTSSSTPQRKSNTSVTPNKQLSFMDQSINGSDKDLGEAQTENVEIMTTKSSSESANADHVSSQIIEFEETSERMINVDFQNQSLEIIVPKDSKSSNVSVIDENIKQEGKKMTCDLFLKRKLGPGTYNTIVGGFSPGQVEQRASGPGWARQLEVERLAALPHLLYKEQWEENKMLKRKLGPGSYEIKDFIQMTNLKPRSSKGICENLASRFDKGYASFTPGPGTYGKGGVPQRAVEEKCLQSTSTKGMLDSGDRKRNLPSVGSHLGPGTYRHKTCTEEMLNKVTSLRGPYELYSGDRNKPISEGYQAAPKLADLGPGQYEIGSFVDDLHSLHKKSHGVFGKMVQYPEVPTERLFLFSQAHCPKRKDIPGPGAYSIQEVSKPQAINSPGFLSSAKRDDKISQKFFTRNFNPVGAGRYDIQKFDDAQDVNGHTSVFRSKTGKPNLQMSKFLQERVRSKDVPVENRMFITEPGKPALCRAVTVM